MSRPRIGATSSPAATPAARPIARAASDDPDPDLLPVAREFTGPFRLLATSQADARAVPGACSWLGLKLPGVVVEVGGGAMLAEPQEGGKALQAAQAFHVGLVAQVLEESEGTPARAVDAAVHTLDVVLVSVPERIDECIPSCADRACTNAKGEIVFRQCPWRDPQWIRVSRL